MKILRSQRLGVVCLLALSLSACGSDRPTSSTDAGLDVGDAADSGTEPSSVAPPIPPSWACPDGWTPRPVSENPAAEACEPWPLGTDTRCPAGQGRFPGDAACSLLGEACPASAFAADATATVFVSAGAALGGDGSSADQALRTIAEGLSRARPGDTVNVAKGTYREAVRIPAGVHLRGACTAETTIESPGRTGVAVVEMGGRDCQLSNLSIRATDRPGIGARADTSGAVSGVSVSVEGIGLWPEGGELTVNRVVVLDTRPLPDGRFGQGASVELGGTLSGSELAILNSTQNGIIAADEGSSATIARLTILGTQARPADNTGGPALRAIDGGRIVVREALLENNTQASVFATGVGASIEIDGAVIRATQSAPFVGEPSLGHGVSAGDNASLILRRVLLEQNRDSGIFVRDGTSASLTDVFVIDTFPEAFDDTRGAALVIQSRSTVTVERVLVRRSRTAAIEMGDAGTTLSGTDLMVLDTLPGLSDGGTGRGISNSFGGVLSLERVLVSDSAESGIALTDGANATLSDVQVRRSQLRGIEVSRASELDLRRSLIQDSLSVGLMTSGSGTRTEVMDLEIVGTEDSSTRFGRAVQIQAESSFSGSNLRIHNNPEAGVVCSGGATVGLSDVVISETTERFCANSSCADAAMGFGVVSAQGCNLRIDDFEIADSALAAIVIGRTGTAQLSNGRVVRNPIAVNIQSDAPALEDVLMNVELSENTRNLDSTQLPIPEVF